MNSYNVYENLYANTKANFTIVKDNNEYTLGEYMLMKAGKKKVPALRNNAATNAVSAFFSYVNEKLTVKNPPAKDRTIRRFPLRTSASAFLSAVIVCGLVLSFGLFSGKNLTDSTPVIAEPETSETRDEYSVEFAEK